MELILIICFNFFFCFVCCQIDAQYRLSTLHFPGNNLACESNTWKFICFKVTVTLLLFAQKISLFVISFKFFVYCLIYVLNYFSKAN